jgi:hypothetical protein
MIRLGFVARKSGSGKMPVTHYQPSGGAYEQPSPIYVEFLAPRVGGKHTRKGSNQGVIEVQSCLHAQTDPYLGLLFVDLLNVSAAEIPELALSSEHQLRLPNPMSFILQKTLIRSNRRRSKQEADLCHIYDVVTLTHDMWAEMRDVLKRLNEDAGFPRKWIPSARTILDKLFSTPTSPGPLAVSSNYHGLVSEKEAVLVMSRFFLECW